MKLLLRLSDPTIVHQDQPLITKFLDMMWALMQVGDKTYSSRPPDKSAYLKIIFLVSQPQHMLWVFKRTISMTWFF